MKRFTSCLAVVFLLGILSGCSETYVAEGPAPGMKVDSNYVGIRMNSVAILDRELQDWYIYQSNLTGPVEWGKSGKIAVEQTGVTRTATNTLQVYTVLRNRTDYPLQIEVRVQFFDANKVPIEGPSSWKRLMMDPQSIVPYKEFSARTDCYYYYIEVREGY